MNAADEPAREHPSLSIVVPAHNEAASLPGVLQSLLSLPIREKEIIVVDDGSEDQTSEVAEREGAHQLVRHRHRRGYGAAIKTGIKHARYPWVATFDADGQHCAEDLLQLLTECAENDMVVGDRSRSESPGMRKLGKGALVRVANFLARQKIPDLNSGLRLFKKAAAERFLALLPQGFSFSTTLTLAFLKEDLAVSYVPVGVRKPLCSRSKLNPFRDGFNTLLLIVRIIVLFDPLRVFLPVAFGLFGLGIVYAVLDSLLKGHVNLPDGAVLLLVSSLFSFFFGILADQISSLRRELK